MFIQACGTYLGHNTFVHWIDGKIDGDPIGILALEGTSDALEGKTVGQFGGHVTTHNHLEDPFSFCRIARLTFDDCSLSGDSPISPAGCIHEDVVLTKHHMGMHDQSTHGDRMGGGGGGGLLSRLRGKMSGQSGVKRGTKNPDFMHGVANGGIEEHWRKSETTPNGEYTTWHVADEMGYHAKPEIVSDEEFNQGLKNGGEELHRGGRDEHLDSIMNDEKASFMGRGIFSNGTHFFYGPGASERAQRFGDTTMRSQLKPGAKIADLKEIPAMKQELIREFERQGLYGTRDQKARVNQFLSQPAHVAMLSGYDAIRVGKDSLGMYHGTEKYDQEKNGEVIVLNRGALRIHESLTQHKPSWQKSLTKHYQGMHDQSTHGDRMGAPGGGEFNAKKMGRPLEYTPAYIDRWANEIGTVTDHRYLGIASRKLEAEYGRSSQYRGFQDALDQFANNPAERAQILSEAKQLRAGGSGTQRAQQLLYGSELAPSVDRKLYRTSEFNMSESEFVRRYSPGNSLSINLGLYNERPPKNPISRNTSGTIARVYIERGARALPILSPARRANGKMTTNRQWIVSGKFEVTELSRGEDGALQLHIKQLDVRSPQALEWGHENKGRFSDNMIQIRAKTAKEAREMIEKGPVASLADAPKTWEQAKGWVARYQTNFAQNEDKNRLSGIAKHWPLRNSESVNEHTLATHRSRFLGFLRDTPPTTEKLYAAGFTESMDRTKVISRFEVGRQFDLRSLSLTHVKSIAVGRMREGAAEHFEADRERFTNGRMPQHTKVLFELEEGAKAIKLYALANNADEFSRYTWGSAGRFEVTGVRSEGQHIVVSIKHIAIPALDKWHQEEGSPLDYPHLNILQW